MTEPAATFQLEALRDVVLLGRDWEPEHMGYALRAAEELLAMRGGNTEAERWYRHIARAAPVRSFVHDGVPIAKERPRLGAGGRTHTPERTAAAEEHLAWAFKLAWRGGAPLGGNLAMVCVFYRPDRRRIDGDNMLKLVCDAGNIARAWGDDSQITTKLARVELDKAHPRTEIAIGYIGSTLLR